MNLFYEGFFFLFLAVVTFLWIWCESGLSFYDTFHSHLALDLTQTELNPSKLRTFNLVHIRMPVFYVFLLIFSFFGTGNIASINTFDPLSIYCFMTVLNPATMGPMMILKLLCPMAMVGTGYAAIHRICAAHVNTTASRASVNTIQENKIHTTVLLVIANFLAVHFFLMLRDEGSWLDIGSSISHYVIAMAIGLASLLLALAGGWMMGSSTAVHIGRPEGLGKFD
uniref:GPI ethanolamine phosphate transferase 1 n=2 Tax=Schistocephalus solidus TaxID=70667 RepID=A0A0X3PH73_SCHSO